MKKTNIPILLFIILASISIGTCYYKYIFNNDFTILEDDNGPLE